MPPSPRRTPDAPLASYLADSARPLTRDAILRRWSRHQLDSALAHGTVTRILPGIYASAAVADTPAVRGSAVNLWAPRALVTGQLALHLYSPGIPAPPTIDVVTANGDTLHPPAWVHVHQTGRPSLWSSPRGVRCTLPERALLEAWRVLPSAGREPLLFETLWSRACTWKQVRQELRRTPRIVARDDLTRVLGWFAAGATTPLEVRARYVTFVGGRFAEFEWQAELRLPHRRVVVDMLHRHARLVVELDGDAYHSTRHARDRDRERQAELTAAGFAVLRFGWRDVVDRPEWCRAVVLRTLASLPRRPGSR